MHFSSLSHPSKETTGTPSSGQGVSKTSITLTLHAARSALVAVTEVTGVRESCEAKSFPDVRRTGITLPCLGHSMAEVTKEVGA